MSTKVLLFIYLLLLIIIMIIVCVCVLCKYMCVYAGMYMPQCVVESE